MLLVIHALPLALGIHLLYPAELGKTQKESSATRARRSCAAVALVFAMASVVSIHIIVWMPVYGPGRSSSTSSIGLLFAPFWGMIFGGAVFAVGRAVVFIMERFTESVRSTTCSVCGMHLRDLQELRCPRCGADLAQRN